MEGCLCPHLDMLENLHISTLRVRLVMLKKSNFFLAYLSNMTVKVSLFPNKTYFYIKQILTYSRMLKK